MEFTTLKEQFAQGGEQAKLVEDHNDVTAGEAKRAPSEKEVELAKLTNTLDERTALADAQKAEIVAGVKQAKVVEDHDGATVGEVECGQSEKEAQLTKSTNALDEQSALADAQKAEIVAGVEQAKSMEDRDEAAVSEVWRALSKRGTELVKLRSAFDERSALADTQKAEITVLTTPMEALKERLAKSGSEPSAVTDHRDAAVRDAERALSEKEAELVKLKGELDERSEIAEAQKADIVALTTLIKTLKDRLAQGGNVASVVVEERGDASVRDANHALSGKEAELVKLRSALDECSATAHLQKTEIMVLKMQVQTLQERLSRAGEDASALEQRQGAAVREAERAVSEKQAELLKLRSTLDERAVAVDAQKAEIVALTRQLEILRKQLMQATEEARAERGHREAASTELKSVTQKLNELVRQTADEKDLRRRAQQDLESRLADQSQLFRESEIELEHLRSEAESAREAEADLRIAIIEIDGRAHTAAHDFTVEKARLQAALERANGERARLSYELTEMKRRIEDGRAPEQVEYVMVGGAS